MTHPLSTPRYPSSDVLRVTRVKPLTLKGWVQRGHIRLADQNPGRGYTWLFSRLDVVKMAVMKHLADFEVGPVNGLRIAEAAAAELVRKGRIDWTEVLSLRMHAATANAPPKFIATGATGTSPLAALGAHGGDWRTWTLADTFDTPRWVTGRAMRDDAGKIDEEGLRLNATVGAYAMPVLLFPVGAIVNATLAQLDAIDVAARELLEGAE